MSSQPPRPPRVSKAAPPPPARPLNRPAAPANQPIAAAKPCHEAPPRGDAGGASGLALLRAAPSWAVSMVFHVVLLLILALITISPRPEETLHEFVIRPASAEQFEPVTEIDIEQPLPVIQPNELSPADLATPGAEISEPSDNADAPAELSDPAPIAIESFDPLGPVAMPKNFLADGDDFLGTGLDLRTSPRKRGEALRRRGGGPDTEDAVVLALKWIASRQAADGGWNFNHNLSANPLPCPNPGTAERARNAATAIAILPFLGFGQTHKVGVYQKEVRAGLTYLVKKMQLEGRAGSWHEPDGSMYSHGLAAIAICEAYAMTHDRDLVAPAQLSINYIAQAQDPIGGGWRYEPRQPGDTSVVGWQIMALKSGHMAYLEVPKATVAGAGKFLDSVAADSGAQYGYTTAAPDRDATTAIGLLCRMHLGWKHDDPALVRGVAILDQRGPSTSDMYYNYYATQVCHHYGGQVWSRWNARMRDLLLPSQEKDGVKAGSWHLGAGHASDRGGRLYTTAMAAMMLEVYYRHMPIYGQAATEDDFPL